MSALNRGLGSSERAELWNRWRAGESPSEISRALGTRLWAVYRFFHSHGGIPQPKQRRNPRALTLTDREEISRGLSASVSLRSIAGRLMRPASTVSREISRNGGRLLYRAAEADAQAWKRTHRPKTCKLAQFGRLRRIVARKLQANWSPEQIPGWLKNNFADDQSMSISHETIYRSLFLQARGVLKKELLAHLRSHRSMRRSKKATNGHGQIVGAVSIRERPAEVKDRAVPGHWEGDLLCGGRKKPYRHACGAALPVHDARESNEQRHRDGGRSHHQTNEQAPDRAAPVPHLGQRHRNGATSSVQRRHRRQSLLLRSSESLAARNKRKHQRAVAPILSQRRRRPR